jgi:hypothetical protein
VRTVSDEDDVRDLFAKARPDAGPALGLDPVAIARDGDRIRHRRRRLQWVGSSAAVVLVLVAVVVIVALLPHGPVGPATPAGPPSTTIEAPSITRTPRPTSSETPATTPATRPSATSSPALPTSVLSDWPPTG